MPQLKHFELLGGVHKEPRYDKDGNVVKKKVREEGEELYVPEILTYRWNDPGKTRSAGNIVESIHDLDGCETKTVGETQLQGLNGGSRSRAHQKFRRVDGQQAPSAQVEAALRERTEELSAANDKIAVARKMYERALSAASVQELKKMAEEAKVDLGGSQDKNAIVGKLLAAYAAG